MSKRSVAAVAALVSAAVSTLVALGVSFAMREDAQVEAIKVLLSPEGQAAAGVGASLAHPRASFEPLPNVQELAAQARKYAAEGDYYGAFVVTSELEVRLRAKGQELPADLARDREGWRAATRR